MLRIAPEVTVANPRTMDEALALLAEHGEAARLVAGGTDVMPNLKHGIYEPTVLVNLKSVEGLRDVEIGEDAIRIGALVGIHDIATHDGLAGVLPSLTDAAARIAGPQLRRMGTLGGNVCLDTRCVYINQTYFWRQSLGFCIKKDGTECHVTRTGKKCVAAASNDTAPVLMSLDATVELASPRGTRTLALDDFYVNDGVKNTCIEPDEILVAVRVPRPSPHTRMAFEKLRVRGAIDFPMLNLALRFDLDDAGVLTRPSLVVSAIAARPRRVKNLPEGPLDDALIDAIAARAFKSIRPLTNINGDVEWRREMVPVLVRRALATAAAGHVSESQHA
jgi:4-hydroxybenzoyl-CoA reductase subunit beta